VLKARMKVGMMMANEIGTAVIRFWIYDIVNDSELTHVLELMNNRYCALPEFYSIHAEDACHE
jgi:hypothetical protein